MIKTGLDVFLRAPNIDGPVGLVTNVATQTNDGRTALRALIEADVEIVALFAPEHGYYGLGAAGEAIADDWEGNLPIYSLYGAARAPAFDVLQTLSAVLIDLQDTGTRWYTFLATIQQVLGACAEPGVPIFILDRPNPQGGLMVEGNLAESKFFSIVAPAMLPVRYGMTVGEAARWLNDEIGADLHVCTLEGWQREMFFEDTGLAWASPSLNMPHARTALIYTGTCLIEGTNLSEGRGTALPFEQIGAPYVRAEELADALNDLTLPNVLFIPAWFKPLTSKYAGQRCEGVRIHVTNAGKVRGFEIGLHLIETLRRLYHEQFAWADWGGQNGFDLLTATTRIRKGLERGQPAAEIIEWCDDEASAFQAESEDLWLYH